MKRSLFILFTVSFTLLLAACGNNEQSTDTEDIKEKVLAYSIGEFENTNASITSHELIVTEEGQEPVSYDLPTDEFFVSIAPFETITHECAVHSLTGCQGELVEKDFDVYIIDEDGNVVLDEKVASFENGFIDLWLPRDQNFDVKISYNGKTVESTLSTFEGDNTCITTMQLT